MHLQAMKNRERLAINTPLISAYMHQKCTHTSLNQANLPSAVFKNFKSGRVEFKTRSGLKLLFLQYRVCDKALSSEANYKRYFLLKLETL